MLQITSIIAYHLPVTVARQCAERLCWDGSEMQAVFLGIASHSLPPSQREWMIAYAWIQQPADADEDAFVIGWASVGEWRVGPDTYIQVQGYVSDEYRERGIASALIACLCHDMPDHRLPIAVFSPEFFRIAQRRGWRATRYRHADDGWIGVATTDGREIGTGPDPTGLHAAAPEVRDLPLARDEAGEAT